MGNTNSNSNVSPSSSRRHTSRQDSTSKQINIATDKSDGFYFAGEYLTGTVEIPISYLHHLQSKNDRKSSLSSRQQSTRNSLIIELVGVATYSSEVDTAADSDGHSTHQVNICRQRCPVTLNNDDDQQTIQNDNIMETSFDRTIHRTSETNTMPLTLPTVIKGMFQLQIPEDLPPSLTNNRTPSIDYTLELNLSSSRYRYQIPITLSTKGYVPHPTLDLELSNSAVNQHDIHLQACTSKRFYRPGEQIYVRVNYSNPQQRLIRSITIRLLQFYRIHSDDYRLQLDGKEWTFDASIVLSQRDWLGETLLQLPCEPLQASFSSQFVGTTQQIECDLDYRIHIELSEKKGDDIQFTLSPIHVTYQ